jgi:hypothetical protein
MGQLELLFHSATRDVSKEMNKISFKIPVHVMNMDTAEVTAIRQITFAIRMGGKKLWHALHEITIGENVALSGAMGTPTVTSKKMSNNVTSVDVIIAGNAVVFTVTVAMPAGYSPFAITMQGNPDDSESQKRLTYSLI